MKVRFVDLIRQNKVLKTKIMDVFETILDKASFIMGREVEEFERSFAKYCNKKYAVAVNSGTDALLIALMAYGIGEGDKVITVPNSYFATSMVISNVGAKPVFVDIDPESYTIDCEKLEKAISKKTKAIIPVHLYGQPADMDPILDIAKKHKLTVIEDVCQAHGALYKGRVVPYGETGAFSFYPSKNLGCFGDAGALVTDNREVAIKALYLRNDGSREKYKHEMFGIKSRMDSLQAATLSFKLPYLDAWNKKRREHAKLYTKLLKHLPGIITPQEKAYAYHVYHIYAIETSKRNGLTTFLKQKGIVTNIHYPIPIHLQIPYRKEGYKEGDFPVTQEKAKKLLSLPMFPELEEGEIEYVCACIREFFQ